MQNQCVSTGNWCRGLCAKGFLLLHKWVSCFGKMEKKKKRKYSVFGRRSGGQRSRLWDGLAVRTVRRPKGSKDLWDRWRVEMNEISRAGRKRTRGCMRCEHGMCQEAGCLPATVITSWRHFCSAKWGAALFPVKDATACGDSLLGPGPSFSLCLSLSLYFHCCFVNVYIVICYPYPTYVYIFHTFTCLIYLADLYFLPLFCKRHPSK